MDSREASAREYAAGLCRQFDVAERMPREGVGAKEAALKREEAKDAGWAFFVQFSGFMSPSAVLDAIGSEVSRNRTGVAAMLLLWIELRYRSDFARNKSLRRRAVNLAMRLGKTSPSLANAVKLALLHASYKARKAAPFYVGVSEQKGGSLFSYRWAVVAKHLCWLDSKLFTEVHIEDFRNKEQSPNLKRFVSRSDAMSWWVASNILRQTSTAKMGKAVQFFLLIAHSCYENGDYFASHSIVGGLQMWAVDRLRQLIKLDKDSVAIYRYLNGVFSPLMNAKLYRSKLAHRAKRKMFCVPHIGIYQKDLTFISDGNPDFMPDGSLNREKIQMIVNALVPLWQFQKNCEANPVPLEEQDAPLLDKLQRLKRDTEEVLTDLSMKVRPSRSNSEVTTATDATATSEASSASDEGSSSRSHTDAATPKPLLPKLRRKDGEAAPPPPESPSPGKTCDSSDEGSPAQSFIASRPAGDQGSDQFKGLEEA